VLFYLYVPSVKTLHLIWHSFAFFFSLAKLCIKKKKERKSKKTESLHILCHHGFSNCEKANNETEGGNTERTCLSEQRVFLKALESQGWSDGWQSPRAVCY
jgi:hypothetical protein